ncbi:MAG: hypothetical protein U1E78_03275 [Gammaproteobacteria bacterium]
MALLIQISVAIICLFFVWRIYKVLKANPELLSRENLTKSFSTMGILALILIGFMAMLVMMLR